MRVLRSILSITCIVILGVCIGYSALCLVPSWNAVSFVSSVLLGSLAPWGIVLAILAGAGWMLLQRTSRWQLLTATAVTVLALAVPSLATGTVMITAAQHGGSVNPISGLLLQSMSAPPDDERSYGEGAVSGSVQIYTPSGGAGSAEAAPVLFDIHGGGWKDDSEMPATLRYFADHGWLVVRPSYTLATETLHTADLVPQQIACAYAWTLQNAERFGGDSQRIAMMGDSAGGGLAISFAQQLARGNARTECGPVTIQPRALFALYPTVSVTAIAQNTFLAANNAAVNFVGATPEQAPEKYRALDAKNWVTKNMPPTLILQGSQDSFVPPESVRTYVEAARAAGANIELIEAPLQNHAFDISFRNSLGWQLATSIALNFLETH